MQVNVLNRRRWDTRDQLRMAIVSWVERTYHRRRRQRALGKGTPTDAHQGLRDAAAANLPGTGWQRRRTATRPI